MKRREMLDRKSSPSFRKGGPAMVTHSFSILASSSCLRARSFARQLSALCVFAILTAGASQGAVAKRFVPFNNFRTGGSPAFTVSGDFNMDGKLDIVASNANGVISFLAGKGQGGFAAPVTILNVAPGAAQIAVGDFNFDGKLDVLYLPLPGRKVYLLRGNGDGTFQAATGFADGTASSALSVNDKLAVADVNGDGKPDVIVDTTNGINVLLNNGSGVLGAAIHTAIAAFPTAPFFTTGDFNNDGRLDIAIGDYQGDLQVLRGQGNGAFALLSPVPGDPFNLTSYIQCAAADLDGDGNVDLVFAEAGNNFPDNVGAGGFNIALGHGDGTFTFIAASVQYSSYMVGGIALADLNKDGKTDILSLNTNANSVQVFTNDGAGHFPSSTNYAVDRSPSTLTIGDFNGDGRPDVAAGESNGISMLLNLGDSILRAPITEDGGQFGDATIATELNGDKIADIVELSRTQPFHIPFGQVNAFLGNRTARFGFATIMSGLFPPPPFFPSYLAVADFNGDGFNDVCAVSADKLEIEFYTPAAGFSDSSAQITLPSLPNSLVAGNFKADSKGDVAFTDGLSLYVMLGLGNGAFAAPSVYAVGSNPVSVTARDLNADGKTDLIVVNQDSSNVSILMGEGNGKFHPAVNYPAGKDSRVLTSGDFNRDNKIDIAVANETNVAILLGNGDGTFQAYHNFPAGAAASSISQESFEKRGIEDIVIAGGLNFFILPGNGDGTFQAPVRFAGGSGSAVNVVTGDFNGDGAPDLALYSTQSMGTTVFFNQGGAHVGLISSVHPSHQGSPVTFTAAVKPSFRGNATPTGSVEFKDGATVIATVTLSAGHALTTTNLLTLGTHSITASYSGGVNYSASTSAAISQSVIP
jgi:Bacterial Ig-like domain (group 3)/FG-GAP-like repeat